MPISPLFGAKGPPARRDGSPPPNLAKQEERRQLQEQRNQESAMAAADDRKRQELIQSILAERSRSDAAREEQEQQRQRQMMAAAAAPITMSADVQPPTDRPMMYGAPPVGTYYGNGPTELALARPMGMHAPAGLPLPYAGTGYPRAAGTRDGGVAMVAESDGSDKADNSRRDGKDEWERMFWIGIACVIVFFLLLQTIFLAILIGRGK